MKLNHYFAHPLYLLIALLFPAILTAASSAYAAEPPSVEAIQAISSKWKKTASAGFTDSQDAQSVMAAFENDKAALASTGDADFQAATAEAQKSLGAFESYLSQTKNILGRQLENELKSKSMMAKRWEMVAKQAMKSGTNVPQNMIDMYKQMAAIETLKENAGIYAAISGATDPKAIEINDQVAYIEQVGVMMGAIETAVTPRDSYAGKDKTQLHAKIEKAWKSQYPDDAIMGIRFIDENWSQRNEMRYNDVTGWYKLNISSMEVKVVTKEDDAIANIYPVFLLKDHLNNNALEIDVESAKSIPGMGSKMLVKNFNP